LIHFDFDERYQDELVVGSALSRRDGVLLSVVVHGAILLFLIFALPRLTESVRESEAERQAREEELLRLQREQRQQEQRFVFVEPRVDFEARRPPDTPNLSDLDRRAQAPQRSVKPTNPDPLSLGNTAERVEAAEDERKQGPETTVEPDTTPPRPEPEEQLARVMPPADTGIRRSPEASRPAPGLLGDALRNLERYVQNQTFNNPQGGSNEPGASIQFDTKGVEFGPWLRRFVAKVRRNWFIPQAAMTFRGRVVVTFNIHKNGQITDLQVVGPSSVESFNRAAYNAILGSNPVDPLPPEYPEPVAFFTVTFLYNEPL
jgi:TonB family protein